MSEKQVVWEGKFLRVVVENGWELVERKGLSGIVGIVPVTENGDILLIEQYRTPVGARCIELPAGLVGDEPGKSDEPIENAARRELLEETGYEAGRLERLFEGAVSAGLSDEHMTWFLASDCRKVGPGGGDSSEDIEVHEVPFDRALEWIAEQRVEGKTIDVKAAAILSFWSRPRPGAP